MRYNNDGEYNRKIIYDALRRYCQISGKDIESTKQTDPDFIEWVVSESLKLATGRNVKRFLENALEIRTQNNNKFRPYQVECLLKTYSNIMIARNWKDWNE